MSTRTTLLSLPCCHIYTCCEDKTLSVDVDYDYVNASSQDIEVWQESEFANLMRYLLKGKTEEELLKASKGVSDEY